jgi:hypothetical protein
MVIVVPHALGPSGEWLDPALDESAGQLEARHHFFGCGSQLPNPLHQGLRDRHFLFGQLVCPRCSGPKDIGGVKLFKPEFLTGGGLVLGVKPSCSPAGIILQRSQLEVFDVGMHHAAKDTGLIMERAPNDEDFPPECLVRFDPQEAFTQHDKARYV